MFMLIYNKQILFNVYSNKIILNKNCRMYIRIYNQRILINVHANKIILNKKLCDAYIIGDFYLILFY